MARFRKNRAILKKKSWFGRRLVARENLAILNPLGRKGLGTFCGRHLVDTSAQITYPSLPRKRESSLIPLRLLLPRKPLARLPGGPIAQVSHPSLPCTSPIHTTSGQHSWPAYAKNLPPASFLNAAVLSPESRSAGFRRGPRCASFTSFASPQVGKLTAAQGRVSHL